MERKVGGLVSQSFSLVGNEAVTLINFVVTF